MKKRSERFYLRIAKAMDVRQLSSMAESLHNQHGWTGEFNRPWKVNFLQCLIRRTSAICVVAESQSEIVGYAIGILETEPAASKVRCRITEIYVTEAFRRRKVATRLLRKILVWAKAVGAFEVVANIAVTNPYKAEKVFSVLNFSPRSVTYVKRLKQL